MNNKFKNILKEDWYNEVEQKWLKGLVNKEFICPFCSHKLIKKYEGWVCRTPKCPLYFKLEHGWVYLDGTKKNNLQFFKDKYNFDIESFENRKRWLKLKEEIFNEREKKCEICGKTFSLDVHHILSRAEHPSLTFDKENLIILCEECHKEIHKGDKHKWG